MPFPRRILAFLLTACMVAACSSASASSTPTASPSGATTPPPTASPSVEIPTASPSLEAPSPSPTASPAASANVVPPKPEDPTFDLIKETPSGNYTTKEEYRITWSSPEGVATSFLVYGVTGCLRESKKNDNTPCVVPGMKIPSGSLVLLRKVPGDKRTTTVSWKIGEIGPGPYSAILIRARNKAGDSIFTIVESDPVCYQCVY